jgi:hypothetical protein
MQPRFDVAVDFVEWDFAINDCNPGGLQGTGCRFTVKKGSVTLAKSHIVARLIFGRGVLYGSVRLGKLHDRSFNGRLKLIHDVRRGTNSVELDQADAQLGRVGLSNFRIFSYCSLYMPVSMVLLPVMVYVLPFYAEQGISMYLMSAIILPPDSPMLLPTR